MRKALQVNDIYSENLNIFKTGIPMYYLRTMNKMININWVLTDII